MQLSDPSLEAEWRLARFALQEGQHRQAVGLYQRALARAYARDDAAAIGDVGYEYSLALLRDRTPQAAAAQARKIRLELKRRKVAVFAELFLVEAVAHYEAQEPSLARAAAEACIARAGADDLTTRARAHFILGLVSADAGDAAAVKRALLAMGSPAESALHADKQELQGRWLLLTESPEAAGIAFDSAAQVRQDLREYAGMARAMAAGAAAAEITGDAATAADLYYRAGRSAAVQEDADKARTWLALALDLAFRNGLTEIEANSREELRALDR